ncbi:haloacid dehalogenase type II [Microvirga lotononidis]|uniref:(S)-2-haloacid dehalogenase n=1 Tax=Microvirga lotononidis TaxID=864069 RepID=I4YNJ0_9HYPH|nr:haloacid dehalogenase type II [Microvirga lotononidis]EIM25532.1 2-haloalkanoic acid dehalogenase, type II [Microvirga lotononidis]WQO26160.1 haloacid dehalogenase type II [Microvirga lotononidis]
MSATIIPARAEAVIFDAYGTLFDVHSAVARHMAEIGPDATRFSEIWRAKQLEYSWVLSLAGRYETFWGLTEKALDHAFARCPDVDPSIRPRLLEAYRSLDAYPEVREALRALHRQGLRTGILSNGDPDMLEAAVESAGLADDLDVVLSVDAAQVFKTSPRAYELVLRALPLKAHEVVFVSSNRWDIAGAAAFGFTPVWVNRLGLPDEYADLAPSAVIGSLSELR